MKLSYKINSECDFNLEHLITIQETFEQTQTTIHKARNEIKRVELNEVQYVVKSFKIPHLLNKIIYTFFRDSKAKKSYNNSLKIEPFAPKAIAYIEFKRYGLLNKSYFISELFNYDFTIREPLLDDNFDDKINILEQFSKFTFDLHEKNIFHNDYSPGNILIQKDRSNYTFKVVDVNRMKFFSLSTKDRAMNFSKLWANNKDLELIAQNYTRHYRTDANFTKHVLHFSNQHKKIKNFKKMLKGILIRD